MSTIGSIGIGLFILIILWIFALVVFVIAVRTQSNLGWFTIAISTIITITLVAIPVEKRRSVEESIIVDSDYSYVYRNILLLILLFSSFVGFIALLILHCVEPTHPKAIKSFYVNN